MCTSHVPDAWGGARTQDAHEHLDRFTEPASLAGADWSSEQGITPTALYCAEMGA